MKFIFFILCKKVDFTNWKYVLGFKLFQFVIICFTTTCYFTSILQLRKIAQQVKVLASAAMHDLGLKL